MSLEEGRISELRATAHPLRLQMLSLLTGAELSAAEVARELDITQANASYHLRLLESAGLLEIAGEESVRGGRAKKYRHPWDAPVQSPQEGGDEDRLAYARVLADMIPRRFIERERGTRIRFTDADLWVEADVWDRVTALLDEAERAAARVGPPTTHRRDRARRPVRRGVPAEGREGGATMKVEESLGVLGDRRFAWYFTARTVSTAGSVMVPVALAFAVLHIDQSAGALAQVLGVRTLALVVFLLVGGVVADRFSRIVVLQVSHVLTGLTQAVAATLIISGHATLTQLTVIEGINGAVSAFTMPAMMGVVPLVVERSRLQQANALLSFSRSGLSIIGPAVAGLLVVGVGPGWALAVDAVTYAVAIVCLSRVGLPRRSEEGRALTTRWSTSSARAGASSRDASGCG